MISTLALATTWREEAGRVRSAPTNPEMQLVRSVQNGDVAAFNQLALAHQAMAYRIAFRVLGDPSAAEDATQEGLVLAYTHINSLRGGSFKAWLFRIVVNACYSQIRKHKLQSVSLEREIADPEKQSSGRAARGESPEDYAERQELGEIIQAGLRTLPPEQRATLVLFDVEGMSYSEVATIMNANIGTVKSRLSRARATLRDHLLAQESLLPSRHARLAS